MRTQTLSKTRWDIDPVHSNFGFMIRYSNGNLVSGVFSQVYVIIFSDEDDFSTAEIEVRISSASVYTGSDSLNYSLKSPDFLDAENFRHIVFIARDPRQSGKDKFRLYGLLSIKDVAKPVELGMKYAGIVKDTWGWEKAILNVTGEIDMLEWVPGWKTFPELDGFPVSNELLIDCEIHLSRKKIG